MQITRSPRAVAAPKRPQESWCGARMDEGGTTERGGAQGRCDFCGLTLPLPRWNCRTCDQCTAGGAPDQSAMPWSEYRHAVRRRLRAVGRLAPLAGAAAQLEAQARVSA